MTIEELKAELANTDTYTSFCICEICKEIRTAWETSYISQTDIGVTLMASAITHYIKTKHYIWSNMHHYDKAVERA